jgi:molybdopterin-guanine dinucleotide biosynthesis protein A
MSVVIQAGGESRRMGYNKALAPFLGQTLIQSVISHLAPIADELLVTSNQPTLLEFLRLPVFPDLISGQGALSGMFTALSIAHYPLVSIVACDMAFVSPSLLVAEREELLKHDADGVVPKAENGYEPFHAVYRREICRKNVKAALDAGQRRADAWFSNVNMIFFTPDQIRPYAPRSEAFININTPQELQQAELLAHKFK